MFAAIGAGGALPPMLAAWAPNLLFGAAALYLLLTVPDVDELSARTSHRRSRPGLTRLASH